MRQRITFCLYIFLCMALHVTAQTAVYTDAYGNLIDEDGNPLSGDYDEDGYIWGRDTTRNEEVIYPIGQFCWTIDERFGDITPAELDTLPDNFQNFNLTAGPTGQYNFLGNLGSPRLSRLFMDRKPYSDFIFADPFDYFYTPVSDFLFTNTLSPITNFSYHSCGNKQNGEDRVRAYFASNINKISGIGFNVDYLYGRGYYNDQATSLFNGTLYGYYLADNYNMHAWVSINHMRLGENGGIEDDEYITHPENFTRSYGSSDIPTNLTENWNRNEDQSYYLNHRYNLGFYRDVELPDSLRPVMPHDTILIQGLRDSLLIATYMQGDTAYQHAVMDSLRQDFMDRQDIPQEFVPVTSFIHTLTFRNAKHTVYSYDTPENYYTNMYYGSLEDMSDRTRAFAVKNTLAIAVHEGFNKWAKAGLTVFASHEYRHFILPDLDGDTKIERGYTENDISVGGQLSKREGNTLHYDVTGEVTLVGNVGQFEVEGNTDLNFKLFKDTVQLAAKAFVKHLCPSFYMRNYHSQFAWWDNDLSMEFRTRIEGTLSLKRTRTSLTVGVENIKNYAYFATDKEAYYNNNGSIAGYSNTISVKQKSGSVQVFSAKLNQDFKLGILRWENEFAYQKSSDQNVLPLPDLSAYSNLYIVFHIAKVLRVQLGADVRFFTEYYAPDYAPIIQQYTVQSTETREKIGNYPICNAYVNFYIKHCRFYINANHINEGSGNRNSFLVPHYPINPLHIRFGISWNFFN